MYQGINNRTATYELSEVLSCDAWGEIHYARYVPHQRQMLVRMVTERISTVDEAWKLMCAELQAWARIKHPGILQVMDWGKAGDRYYFATEMPEGAPLESVISEKAGVKDPEAVFLNLLKSIEAARIWGVLHLGLNLKNIWISTDGKAQVGEYGLWYVAREYPGIGEENGLFAAPEQKNGERVSAATDVYSLGLLLVALECGLGAAREVADGASPPEDLEGLRPLVWRCLDRQPLARFSSAGELAAELGHNPGGWAREEYRDCPICRLQDEIMKDAEAGDAKKKPDIGFFDRYESLIWAAIVLMAATAVVFWLLTVW